MEVNENVEDSLPCCDSPKSDITPDAGCLRDILQHSAPPSAPGPVPECPICFSAYDWAFRAPLQLPLCRHTFCLVCLSRMSLFPSHPQGFQCPLCRTAVPLPPGGVPCLSPNAELLSGLPPPAQAGGLRRVWLEGPVLCYWTGPEGGGAMSEGVVRLPLIGPPPPGTGVAGAGGEGQPVAMVTVLSRRRLGSCRNIRALAMMTFLLLVIIFFTIFLPVYFQRS